MYEESNTTETIEYNWREHWAGIALTELIRQGVSHENVANWAYKIAKDMENLRLRAKGE